LGGITQSKLNESLSQPTNSGGKSQVRELRPRKRISYSEQGAPMDIVSYDDDDLIIKASKKPRLSSLPPLIPTSSSYLPPFASSMSFSSSLSSSSSSPSSSSSSVISSLSISSTISPNTALSAVAAAAAAAVAVGVSPAKFQQMSTSQILSFSAVQTLPSSLQGKNVNEWKEIEVANWLLWLNKDAFQKYVNVFTENAVDGKMLLSLTDHELQQNLKVMNPLHRRRLLSEISLLSSLCLTTTSISSPPQLFDSLFSPSTFLTNSSESLSYMRECASQTANEVVSSV